MSSTFVGVTLLVLFPNPKSPYALKPQPYNSLFSVITIVLLFPAAILITFGNPSTLYGVYLFPPVTPSCQNWLLPQVHTFPSESKATLWFSPAAICVINVPSGNFTSTGSSDVIVVPFPSCPTELSPHV